jgi:hypothetical protein
MDLKYIEGQPITRNIAKKGFSSMRSSSPASISLYLDSDVLRNPFQAILPTLGTIIEKRNKHENPIYISLHWTVFIAIM